MYIELGLAGLPRASRKIDRKSTNSRSRFHVFANVGLSFHRNCVLQTPGLQAGEKSTNYLGFCWMA